MPSSFTCPGCAKVYGKSNHLIQHWRKSNEVKCVRAAEAHQEALRLASNSGPRRNRQLRSRSASPPVAQADTDKGPVLFEGDFYGDTYGDEDFPGFDVDSDEEVGGGVHDEDEDDGDVGEIAAEQTWEPTREPAPLSQHEDESMMSDDNGMDVDTPQAAASTLIGDIHSAASAPSSTPAIPSVYMDKFGGLAGAPTSKPRDLDPRNGFAQYQAKIPDATENLWAPFRSQMDWEVARWAKLRGLGSTAFSDLLAIDGVFDALGLSYNSSTQLNKIIDMQIPSPRPAFTREEVVIAGQSFDFFKRDILKCIRALFGDPDHSQYLCIVPERHYADADKTVRLYHDFHTGRWWWGTQQALEKDKPGATIIPVILSSDKTQITLFRNKSAYPVYLTIGNLPKEIRRKPSRRGQILIAYLPTTRLEHIKNKAARRRTIANLFHACMSDLVQPLKDAGLDGVIMTSGDGITRRCHPIFAAYIGDYPEQVLVTCTYYGDSPVCECPADELGNYPCEYVFRDFETALKAISEVGTTTWAKSCLDANIKPVQHPFWESLPYVDIFRAITPDILHQLLQGVMKHLIGWLITICGAVEVDARVRRLPPGHGMRVFYKGISTLSRVSGTEHKQICAFLLGVITDITLPPADRQFKAGLLRATRALLDFLSLARYPIHSDQTLSALEASLASFHADKHVFIALGARENFNFPKLHFLAHYVRAIRFYGTTDNYNTEATERLHIDFAKDAYASTNRKDEFLQMTRWLERREKIMYHTNYIAWRCMPPVSRPSTTSVNFSVSSLQPLVIPAEEESRDTGIYRSLADMNCAYEQTMTRFPTIKSVPLEKIENRVSGYGATLFTTALARFIARYRHPDYSANEIEEVTHDIIIPFRSVPVYHRIKFVNRTIFGNETQDSIHAYPRRPNARKQLTRAARFDTALIKVRNIDTADVDHSSRTGLEGMRIGRVRVIFSLPDDTIHQLFPSNVTPPPHLAYVEWFTKFPARPEADIKMYKVKREIAPGGTPLVTVLPIELIKRSVYLFPKWGPSVPAEWASDTVLDRSPAFFMNPFRDIHTYFELTPYT